MKSDHHQWITLHRLRFPSEISALERKFEAPALADCWRFCPTLHLGDNGLPIHRSDTWFGFGIYDRRDAAETMFAGARELLPCLAETVEEWHAVLVPFTHRGQVNWRGTVEDGTAIEVSSNPPAGPLAVITSAGYNARTPDQMPRIARFVQGIQDVLDFYGSYDGNLRRVSTSGGFDSRDGFTVTLWRDDKAMNQAAYAEGTHRTFMDMSRDGSLFDRSSFTRARVVASSGSWEGDPLAGLV
jgi:hypothetical protein